MKKILITGAGGFVGAHLLDALRAQDESDIYATLFRAQSEISKQLSSNHIVSGDLTDQSFAHHLLKTVNPDVIYHLASLSVVENSTHHAAKILTDNLLLQYNLLEAMRLQAPHARLIAICSANEYGRVKESEVPIDEETPLRPLNPYAVSKVTQDMLAYQYYLSYGLDIIRLRPFNHTGAGQSTQFVIPALAKQFVDIKSGKQEPVVQVGNLESVRDFTAVEDMVRAYVLAAAKGISGEVYNIGSGQGVTVREIISELESLVAVKVRVITQDTKIRTSDVPILIADTSKFRALTLWHPTLTLRQTLENVYNHWQEKSS